MFAEKRCPKIQFHPTLLVTQFMIASLTTVRCACLVCGYEWTSSAAQAAEKGASRLLDTNGNELHNGDTIIVVKVLPVKSAPKVTKTDTQKYTSYRERAQPCKIDDFGAMRLKSEFVRKACLVHLAKSKNQVTLSCQIAGSAYERLKRESGASPELSPQL